MALVTLALGIGANTAIFSIVNGVLIKSLPFPHSEDLVSIWHSAPGLTRVVGDLDCSPAMYFTYREENRTFQEFGLWENRSASVTGIGDPEELRTLLVTYGTLQALDVQPAVGQWFSQADDTRFA
jgi:putative ABC transport system permease protein